MKHMASLFLLLCLLFATGTMAQDTLSGRQYKHDAMRLWAEGTYKGYLKSVPLLSEAIAADPSDEDALWKLMKAHSVTYRMDEAIETAKTGRERFPENGDWGAALYFLYRETRHYEAGESSRKEILDLAEQTYKVYEKQLEANFSPERMWHYLLFYSELHAKREKLFAILDNHKEQLKFSESIGEDLFYNVIRSRLDETSFRKEMKWQLHIDFMR